MTLSTVFQNKALYNLRINEAQHVVFADMSAEHMSRDRGLFFGSILNMLNHIMVGDIVWIARIETGLNRRLMHEEFDLIMPARLNQVLYSDYAPLSIQRQRIDEHLQQLVGSLNDNDYANELTFSNMRGTSCEMPLHLMLDHLFNHQTHHRGQVTTALSQLDVDFGSTDMIDYI